MAPGVQHNQDEQLQLALELINSNAKSEDISQYHRDLIKWGRNIDQRYAWIVMVALWLMMAVTLGPYRVYGLIYAHVTQEGIYTRQEASWPVSLIFTVTNLIGPIVSLIVYHISYRNSMLLGGLLTAIGNMLAYFSTTLWMDIMVIGILQGIGIAFVFMPFMEIINNYFIRRRNLALGFALCGGTMAVFVISPLCQYILDNYPWRTAYLGIGWICLLGILLVPFLKPNPRPNPRPNVPVEDDRPLRSNSNLSVSVRALSRHASIVSVSPYASSVGLERKISRAINLRRKQSTTTEETKQQQQQHQLEERPTLKTTGQSAQVNQVGHQIDSNNSKSEGQFGLSVVVRVLKTPGFHLVWYMQALFFWMFTIFCLIVVDYAKDHGCNQEEAESLLDYQSVGEILGRMLLTSIVDLKFMSIKTTVVVVLLVLIASLVAFTQTMGIIWMASLTMIFSSFACLLYIMLNGLLVTFLGERQVTLGFGMASSIVGVLVIGRPQAVGYFRDSIGSYDPLMLIMAMGCMLGIVLVLLEGWLTSYCSKKESRTKTTTTTTTTMTAEVD